jgi:uncharacterized protein YbjT (DUF2867 family)
MTTVLVAGGTGMLGSRIADYLEKETGVQVRLLVRDGWEDDDAKRQRVDPLVTQGATIAISDVTSPESLAAATLNYGLLDSRFGSRQAGICC